MIFEGKISASSNAKATIVGPLGAFEEKSSRKLVDGTSCIAVVPSEYVKFSKKVTGKKNCIKGYVDQVSFVQNLAILYLRTANGMIQKIETHIDKVQDNNLDLGSEITITWESENSSILGSRNEKGDVKINDIFSMNALQLNQGFMEGSISPIELLSFA